MRMLGFTPRTGLGLGQGCFAKSHAWVDPRTTDEMHRNLTSENPAQFYGSYEELCLRFGVRAQSDPSVICSSENIATECAGFVVTDWQVQLSRMAVARFSMGDNV